MIFDSLWRLLIQLLRWCYDLIHAMYRSATAPSIQFDTGRSVRLGKQIAEGGFSYVFEATDGSTKYALKRIHVGDREAVQACLREAGVHRSLKHHPNLMPLLGLCQEKVVVYMLFPFMPQSLRSVVNKCIFESTPPRKPFPELKVLQLMHQIMSGVSAMHDANYSHRDIKLENILLDPSSSNDNNPVLMDFGSVGPLEQPIVTRQQVLTIIETATQHTTLPYRPPELLEGGLRTGDAAVDFSKVDVWSLGCTMFAICFGASPFECEFRNGSPNIRIVECTQLRILGKIPTPPTGWYSPLLLETIQLMLTQDRHKRPTLDEAMVEIEAMIQNLGGRVPKSTRKGDDDGSDLDALLSSNRFV